VTVEEREKQLAMQKRLATDVTQMIAIWTDDDRKDQCRMALREKKKELEARRGHIDKEIIAVDRAILMLTRGPVQEVEPAPESKRVRVGELTKQVIRKLSARPSVDYENDPVPRWIDEDDLVEAVLREEPMGRPKSIKGALARLVKANLAARQGPRGSYSYQWRGPVSVQPFPEDAINTALAVAGRAGVSKEELVEKAGSGSGKILAQRLADGTVEKFPVGDGKFHYRIPGKDDAEPEPNLFYGTNAGVAG
jgi:hypothetical protein